MWRRSDDDLDALSDAFSAASIRAPPIRTIDPSCAPHASLTAMLALADLEKVSVSRR